MQHIAKLKKRHEKRLKSILQRTIFMRTDTWESIKPLLPAKKDEIESLVLTDEEQKAIFSTEYEKRDEVDDFEVLEEGAVRERKVKRRGRSRSSSSHSRRRRRSPSDEGHRERKRRRY